MLLILRLVDCDDIFANHNVQLVETYRLVQSQYNQMLWMAQMVPAGLRAHYRALITPWHNSYATNTYGTTGGWIAAINTGTAVPAGYEQAIQLLNTYGAALSNVPGDQLELFAGVYVTVRLKAQKLVRQHRLMALLEDTLARLRQHQKRLS